VTTCVLASLTAIFYIRSTLQALPTTPGLSFNPSVRTMDFWLYWSPRHVHGGFHRHRICSCTGWLSHSSVESISVHTTKSGDNGINKTKSVLPRPCCLCNYRWINDAKFDCVQWPPDKDMFCQCGPVSGRPLMKLEFQCPRSLQKYAFDSVGRAMEKQAEADVNKQYGAG
ncbi:hypothetical protein BaRGS_00027410, partial [Batillaria attramentaria]